MSLWKNKLENNKENNEFTKKTYRSQGNIGELVGAPLQ